jgi:hypothetical protein
MIYNTKNKLKKHTRALYYFFDPLSLAAAAAVFEAANAPVIIAITFILIERFHFIMIKIKNFNDVNLYSK